MNQNCTNFSAQCLPLNQHALLNKFYRSHNSRMRITAQADAWVVRAPSIIAGLCLSPVAGGYWLTSLFTAPESRQQGVASFLIKAIQAHYPNSAIWLFCHPELEVFYSTLGFTQTQLLPETLSSRLTRYQQHKALIAMLHTKHTTPAI